MLRLKLLLLLLLGRARGSSEITTTTIANPAAEVMDGRPELALAAARAMQALYGGAPLRGDGAAG